MKRVVLSVPLLFSCLLSPSALADWTWTLQTDVGETSIWGIDALSRNQVWGTGHASGSGSIYFYNGTSWSLQTSLGSSRSMSGISAADSNHVWAVGYDTSPTGYIYSFNGTSWSLQTTIANTNLRAVSSSGASGVWAGGYSGEIYHYNGSSWSLQTDTGTNDIRSLEALNSSNVWAGTASGRIYYYNGSSWALQTDTGITSIRGLSAVGPNHAWAVGYDSGTPETAYIFFYNGSSWTVQTAVQDPPLLIRLYGVHAISPSRVWAVGPNGRIYFYDGTSWSLQTAVGATLYSVTSATGAGFDSVWASASFGRIFHTEGRAIPEPSTALLLLLIAPGLLPFAKRLKP